MVDSINMFFNYCKKEFEYGWIDKNGKKHYESNNSKNYFLQSPEELLKNKISICWDRTELYRVFFEKLNVKHETYMLYYYINDNCCPSHSILVYYKNEMAYWFEPMFNSEYYNYSGIHEYFSIEDLLKDFKKRFTEYGIIQGFLPNECIEKNYHCYRYIKPKYHLKDNEFYEHCRKGKRMKI